MKIKITFESKFKIQLVEFPFKLYFISKQISFFISLYIFLMHILKSNLTFFNFSSNYMHRVTISPWFSAAIIMINHKINWRWPDMKKKQAWKILHSPNLIFVFPPLSAGLIKRCYLNFQATLLFMSLDHHHFSNSHILSSPLERETLLLLLATGSVLKHYHCLALCHSGCTGNWFEQLWRESQNILEWQGPLSVTWSHTHSQHSQLQSQMQLQSRIRLLRVIPGWGWSASKDGDSTAVALWSTHCSLDAVGYLNASHHAAIQHWASRSLCWATQSLVLQRLCIPSCSSWKNHLPSVLEWQVRTMWIAGTFIFIFVALGFRKYFLPVCLSIYPILIFFLPRKKKQRNPQIPIKPQTLEL